MTKRDISKSSHVSINDISRIRRIIMVVVIAVAVGLMAYGAWIGVSISLG